MPRRCRPKKDVASCEKPRGAASGRRTGDIRMGKPGASRVASSLAEEDRLGKGTGGTETSKYPEEKKALAILRVAASERGRA